MYTYNIISNDYEYAKKLSKKFANTLNKSGFILDEVKPQYFFVIGGDGTFLKAFHQYEQNFSEIIFIPFHIGGFGFYTKSNEICNLKQIIDQIKQNKVCVKQYSPIKLISDDHKLYAINEIKFVNSEKPIQYFLKINDEQPKKMKGSGLAISSSTGSSGFNKSNNGAIIYNPAIPTIQVSEINSCYLQEYFCLKTSLIFFEKTTLEIEVKQEHDLIVDAKKVNSNSDYILTIDNKKVSVLDCK